MTGASVRRRLAGAAFALAMASATATAQADRVLSGVVRDVSGAVVPGVSVTVTGTAPVVTSQTVVTSELGRYEIRNLAPGRYVVEATLDGFAPQAADIVVETGPATLDLVLTAASFYERLTVTATKMGTADIQQTAIAITALPGRTIQQLGAETLAGLAGFVPSVTISQPAGFGVVTIRGIGSNTIISGADPSSTIHLDGVYLGRPAMALTDFLDVERVEVLRGPQGTLYGRNSVGGTINIVTRTPTNALETNVRLTAGDFDTLRAEGAVSGPLVRDKVMGSFAFLRGARQGFVRDLNHPDNELGGDDTWAGRGQLRIIFGPRSELLFSADYAHYDAPPLADSKAIAVKPECHCPFDNPSSPWEVRTDYLGFGNNVERGASAHLTIPVAATVTLKSLTAYRKSTDRRAFDLDVTELPLQTIDLPDRQHQFSEEATLSRVSPRLKWVTGAFLFDEQVWGPVVVGIPVAAIEIRPNPTLSTTAWALFGEATYGVSDRVSLTGGLRYSDERKDLDNGGGTYVYGTPILIPGSDYKYSEARSFNAWTPRATVQMQATPDVLLYASAARGFKAGGFNVSAHFPTPGFEPEHAWTYETGLKKTLANGRLRTNAAVFYTDYQDLQVQSFISTGFLDITNAATASIKGLEFEAGGMTRGLQLAGHIAWLDATYGRYPFVGPDGVAVDQAGNRLNNAPEWSGSGSAMYQFAAGTIGWLSMRCDASWQSRVFFSPFNDAIQVQGPYALLHLRAGFQPRSRRWELAAYVRNTGNLAYINDATDAPIPAFAGHPGPPRQWGTQFTFHP